jgi:hypothetical protein
MSANDAHNALVDTALFPAPDAVIAAVIAVAGLVVVLLALRGDTELKAPAPSDPEWDILPTRSDLARTSWPLRLAGYDPAAVERSFERLADTYADLLREADPAAIARARRRSAERLGVEDPEAPVPAGSDLAGSVPTGSDPAGSDLAGSVPASPALALPDDAPRPDATVEALRTAAALDVLGRRNGS